MGEKKKSAKVQEPQAVAPVKGKAAANVGGESIVEEISEDMDRFETWVIENGKYILVGCVVVVIAIAVVFSVMHFIEKSKQKSAEVLAKADTIEELEKTLNESSSEVGRDMALMRLAQLYIAKKDYASAIRNLEKVVQAMREPYIAYRAQLDIGYVNELAGKPEVALAAFAGVADAAVRHGQGRWEGGRRGRRGCCECACACACVRVCCGWLLRGAGDNRCEGQTRGRGGGGNGGGFCVEACRGV